VRRDKRVRKGDLNVPIRILRITTLQSNKSTNMKKLDPNRIITKKSLSKALNDDYEGEIEGDLYTYFEDTFGKWNWPDIGREGVSVFNLIHGSDADEDDSIIAGVFSAVAAQSYVGAIKAMAAATGIDVSTIESALSDWYENEDELPLPIGANEFANLLLKEQARNKEE